MSLTETTLDDFQHPRSAEPGTDAEVDEPSDDKMAVRTVGEDTDTNHQCDSCGTSVSPRYHKFHRDENNVLRRCPHCEDVTKTDMTYGAGAVDDFRERRANAEYLGGGV